MRIIFLDFDGVMHPHEVYHYRDGRGIVLEAEGHTLFEHAGTLTEMLAPHPEIRIILSTSWVSTLDFKRAKGRLPMALQDRVKGSTFHSSMDITWWNDLTRYEQIASYVARHRLHEPEHDWIAVDDDDEGWPAGKRKHLVHCDQHGGIGDRAAQTRLIDWLAQRPFNDRRMR